MILGPTTSLPLVNGVGLLASLGIPLLTSNVVGVNSLVVIFASASPSISEQDASKRVVRGLSLSRSNILGYFRGICCCCIDIREQ